MSSYHMKSRKSRDLIIIALYRPNTNESIETLHSDFVVENFNFFLLSAPIKISNPKVYIYVVYMDLK